MRSIIFAILIFGSFAVSADSAKSAPDKPATTFDKRLPPVMPGETVLTEQGDKIKVWSSAGPVPVQQQPQQQGSGPIGVIVDGRNPSSPINGTVNDRR